LETLEIQADPRKKGKKRDAKRLLRNGRIPGVLYGPKTAPLPLEFQQKEFSARVAALEGSHLVRLKSDAASLADKVALVKAMQYHPISGDVIHADLYEVDLSVKITVSVPLRFVGKAAGVVRGGILQPIVREIEVECLPLDIPEFFNVDVSELDIGDAVHVEDMAMPEGVQAIYESNFALVTVATPSVEEAPAPAAVAEAAVAPAAPEAPKEEES
jgi:large subunit ribosomal protein L25